MALVHSLWPRTRGVQGDAVRIPNCDDEDCRSDRVDYVMTLPGFRLFFCRNCGRSFRVYRGKAKGRQERPYKDVALR